MKLFVDGGSLSDIIRYSNDDRVTGFTTNPSLLRAAGVTDYTMFAKDALSETDKPISFETLADSLDEIRRQAHVIASWGDSVYVKVPITTTQGQSTFSAIGVLAREGVKVNVTAVFTLGQMGWIEPALSDTPSIVSVFAGRIADTGRDPVPIVQAARRTFKEATDVLWASSRSVYDYYLAERADADIITMPPSLIEKLDKRDYPLETYSLDTVRMFHEDAVHAGYEL